MATRPPPKKNNWHEWANTGIAGVALVASIAAAIFAWDSNQAKKEALAIVPQLNGGCRTEYQVIADHGAIGLCWAVTLANDSEDRLSIVDYRVFSVQEGGLSLFGGFDNLEGEDGKSLTLPLNLDGGEAKKVFVRAGFMVPVAVARVIEQLPDFKSRTLTTMPLKSIENVLAAAGLSPLGDTVQPMFDEGKVMGWSFPNTPKRAMAVLHVKTGRGSEFDRHMGYPSD